MFETKTRVLLVLSQDILDRARVLAGQTTTALKLPVSLQIVLRALLKVGSRRENQGALMASVESEAKAVGPIRWSWTRSQTRPCSLASSSRTTRSSSTEA